MRTSVLTALLLSAAATTCKREPRPEFRDYRKTIGAGELYFHVQTHDPSEPYILYLNGGPGDVSVRARALFEAVGLRRNIIFLDQRGCGRSQRDVPKESFSFENLVKDIDGVLDALGLNRVIIIGHSWGAVYGIKYALSRPHRVIGLIGVSPMDSWERALDRYYERAPAYALSHLELLKKLSAPAGLTYVERRQLDLFCAFMWAYHEGKESAALYRACENNSTELDVAAVSAELRADLDAINKHEGAENRWPGWSARGIRRKYGLYKAKPGCDRLCETMKQRANEWYTDDERAYSKGMEEGLWVNDGWGQYYALDDLPKLKTEFFYLYGKHDSLFGSPEMAEWTSTTLGPDHVVLFDDAGHSPMSESPEEFKRTVWRLVGELAKREARR